MLRYALYGTCFCKLTLIGAEAGWCYDDSSDTRPSGVCQTLLGERHWSVPVPWHSQSMEPLLKCKTSELRFLCSVINHVIMK